MTSTVTITKSELMEQIWHAKLTWLQLQWQHLSNDGQSSRLLIDPARHPYQGGPARMGRITLKPIDPHWWAIPDQCVLASLHTTLWDLPVGGEQLVTMPVDTMNIRQKDAHGVFWIPLSNVVFSLSMP